jgi:tetratricopeptide (TPR) repeat protein
MGRCYLELGAFDKSRENGEKAMNLASEAKDMTWYLNASVLVALSEAKSEDWNSALQSYERSLEIAKIVHDNVAEEAITKALEEVNQKIVEELKSKESCAEGGGEMNKDGSSEEEDNKNDSLKEDGDPDNEENQEDEESVAD